MEADKTVIRDLNIEKIRVCCKGMRTNNIKIRGPPIYMVFLADIKEQERIIILLTLITKININ